MAYGKKGLLVAGLVFFCSALRAQTLTVTPGGGLTTGETATIEYSNPSRANTTITVTVSGGYPVVTTVEIQIALDSKGNGKGSWVVTNWGGAHFNAPDVHEVAKMIR